MTRSGSLAVQPHDKTHRLVPQMNRSRRIQKGINDTQMTRA